MRDEFKGEVRVGTVVQVNQNAPGEGKFLGCFMTVTEAKAWGANGFVMVPKAEGNPGIEPMRLQWKEMEFVGLSVVKPRQ